MLNQKLTKNWQATGRGGLLPAHAGQRPRHRLARRERRLLENRGLICIYSDRRSLASEVTHLRPALSF